MHTPLPAYGVAALLALTLTGSVAPDARPLVPAAGVAAAYRQAAAAMAAAGEPYASWSAAGRRFLAFDPGGTGRAVEVIGDLAAARHVAVVVPGVNTRLADFDRGLGGVARRAPAIQARALYTAMRAATTAPVAVVAWLGYLPPPGVGPGAATAGHARAGARDLAAFVPAYLAGRQVTLVGHSYGALVVGLAAPRLPQVRDVVLLGAPGAGHDRAADLGGARVWAALSADDWVRRIPQLRLGPLGHGRRPTAPRFGATGLPTDGRVRARQLPGGRRGDPGRRRSRCSRNRGRRNRGRRNRGRRDRGRRAPATACRARAPGGAVVA